MGHKLTDITGQRFGRLVALEHTRGNRKWKCLCDCGTVAWVTYGNLKNCTSSCGCWNREVATARHLTHGKSTTREYQTWGAIKRRCYNPKQSNYSYYGGRGITVCDRWRNSFSNFLADMGERPAGHTIERIDNNGQYSPENCRWATMREQRQNLSGPLQTRPVAGCPSLAEAARRYGVNRGTLQTRLDRLGWTADAAVSTPVRHHKPYLERVIAVPATPRKSSC